MAPEVPVLVRNGDGSVKLNDFDLAIYFMAKRLPIHYGRQISRSTYEFRFYDPHEIADDLAREFINGQSDLQPVDYADAQRRLKRMLHQFVTSRR
jgi:hypothetical protein